MDALEARVAAPEARTTNPAPLTSAEAAAYARVNVETIRRAIRTGLLPTKGAVGRSPRIAREALDAWIAQKSRRLEIPPPRRRRARARTSTDAVDAAWRELLDTYGHVIDELEDVPRLAAVDAILQARAGSSAQSPGRPGLTVSSR
jgi:excisionase family DNA binding protein